MQPSGKSTDLPLRAPRRSDRPPAERECNAVGESRVGPNVEHLRDPQEDPDNVASCWDVTRRVVPRTSTLWEALGRRCGEAAPLPDHVLRVMCLRDNAKERRQVCAGCDGVTSSGV